MSATGKIALAQAIAGVGGVGALPKFQGTAASVLALALGFPALVVAGRPAFVLVALAVFAAGLWAATAALRHTVATGGMQQPERLVIADFAGLLLALTAAPTTPAGAILTFLAFRLFFAARPWPIHWYDFGVGRGAGAVLDGALAALGGGTMVFLSAWALGETF